MQSSSDAPQASFLGRVGTILDRYVTPRVVRPLAIITAVTMFIVYALGTLVTTSGSGHGCGASWPLCHGQFIPEFAISTAIEFTHRVATAAVTVLVLLLAIHFGTSLVLFSSVLLTAIIVNELGGWDRLRDLPIATGFRVLVFALAAYTYVVGYLGAYMRLRGAELGCRGWPACNGALFPGFSGFVGIAFTHRVAAFILLAGTVWLFVWARSQRAERPDLYRGAFFALLAVITQVLAGGLVALTSVARYSQLLHAGLVALLFGALIYVCLQTLRRPQTARIASPEPAPATSTEPAAPAAAQQG